eukprot:s7208_g3.t1
MASRFLSWKANWQKPREGTASEQSAGMDAPTQELVKCMAKLVIKHEQELMRLRPDLGFVIFADTSDLGCLKMLRAVAESWQEKYESPQHDPREAPEGEDGRGAWKRAAAPEDPPLKHAECLRRIDTLIENLPKEGVLTKFSTPKGLQENYETEVIPFNLTLSLQGTSSDLCYQALRILSGCAVTKMVGLRMRPERISKPPLAKAVEDAFMATPLCDWKKSQLARQSVETRVGLGRPPVAAARRDAQLMIHEGLHLPVVQPVNNSNLCYINSVMQAANWLGAITSAPALSFGRLQAGFNIFVFRRMVRLIDAYAFRPLFLSWADVHRQHDAGEFLGALLTATQ